VKNLFVSGIPEVYITLPDKDHFSLQLLWAFSWEAPTCDNNSRIFLICHLKGIKKKWWIRQTDELCIRWKLYHRSSYTLW